MGFAFPPPRAGLVAEFPPGNRRDLALRRICALSLDLACVLVLAKFWSAAVRWLLAPIREPYLREALLPWAKLPWPTEAPFWTLGGTAVAVLVLAGHRLLPGHRLLGLLVETAEPSHRALPFGQGALRVALRLGTGLAVLWGAKALVLLPFRTYRLSWLLSEEHLNRLVTLEVRVGAFFALLGLLAALWSAWRLRAGLPLLHDLVCGSRVVRRARA